MCVPLFTHFGIGNSLKLTYGSEVTIRLVHGNFESSELAHDEFLLLKLLFCRKTPLK